jgi:hypothetical protein
MVIGHVPEIILGLGWALLLAITIYYGLGLRRRLTPMQMLLAPPFGEFSRFYIKFIWPILAAIGLMIAVFWDERLPWLIKLCASIVVTLATVLGIVLAFHRGLRPVSPRPKDGHL